MRVLDLKVGDQINVVHSYFIWTVVKVKDDGSIWTKNCNGARASFTNDEVLGIVQRKG